MRTRTNLSTNLSWRSPISLMLTLLTLLTLLAFIACGGGYEATSAESKDAAQAGAKAKTGDDKLIAASDFEKGDADADGFEVSDEDGGEDDGAQKPAGGGGGS